MPTKIEYKIGDATRPEWGEYNRAVILHVCNDVGAWGAGFTGALDAEFGDGPKMVYQDMVRSQGLGDIHSWIKLSREGHACRTVINMIAQRGVLGPRPWLRMDALETCLEKVEKYLNTSREMFPHNDIVVVGPRFGSGISGGNWDDIAELVERTLSFPVHIYDLPGL